jgi:F0F1-type ATP synthase membrane subunit a
MIALNRDNVMLIATIVCVVGVIFLLRELKKTKEELYEIRNFSEDVMDKLNSIQEDDFEEEEESPTTAVVEEKE